MADLQEIRRFAEHYLPAFERGDLHRDEFEDRFYASLIAFSNPLDRGNTFASLYGENVLTSCKAFEAALPRVSDPMLLCSGMAGHFLMCREAVPFQSILSPRHRLWFRMGLVRLKEIAQSLFPQSLQTLSGASRVIITSKMPDAPGQTAFTETLSLTSAGKLQLSRTGMNESEEAYTIDSFAAEQLLSSVPLFIEHCTEEYVSGQGCWEIRLEDDEAHFCAVTGCLTPASDLYADMSRLFRTLLKREELLLFDGGQARLDSLAMQLVREDLTAPGSGTRTTRSFLISAKAQTITMQLFVNDRLEQEQTVRIGSSTRTLLDAAPLDIQGSTLVPSQGQHIAHSIEVHWQYMSGADGSASMELNSCALSPDVLDFLKSLNLVLPARSIFDHEQILEELSLGLRCHRKVSALYVVQVPELRKMFRIKGPADLYDAGDAVIVQKAREDREYFAWISSRQIACPYQETFPSPSRNWKLLRRAELGDMPQEAME